MMAYAGGIRIYRFEKLNEKDGWNFLEGGEIGELKKSEKTFFAGVLISLRFSFVWGEIRCLCILSLFWNLF